MLQKLKVAVLMGGKSTEHEISLRSGKSIIDAIDQNKYEIFVIGIDKKGKWFLQNASDYLHSETNNPFFTLKSSNVSVQLWSEGDECYIKDNQTHQLLTRIDVVFPILHGTYGEDGTLQGVLKAHDVAFVGVDLMASAVGMDKDLAKRVWRDAGIPIASFVTITPNTKDRFDYQMLTKMLGSPLFVKPANAGSSVGVHKVQSEEQYHSALNDAFLYDRKVLIEEAISGIEVECAVLGNEFPEASVIGAIKPTHTFYSYEAKYVDNSGAQTEIPANIPEEVSNHIRQTAIKAFQAIGCEGLSRVDFFLRPDHSIILNEINTMPGFTNISMYPKLWEATGLPFKNLLDKLIQLAIERQKSIRSLKVVQ